MQTVVPPARRFRRRLRATMLVVGLAPVVIWTFAGAWVLDVFGALSLSRAAEVLARAENVVSDAALRDELVDARLLLVQASLAHHALVRLAPEAMAGVFLASAIALGLASWAIGRAVSRPVEALSEAMRGYAAGTWLPAAKSPVVRRPDELALLVQQFHELCRELEAKKARLHEAEAIAAWQGAARALAHELTNPLTAMRMALGRLARGAGSAKSEEAVALIAEEVDVLARLAAGFASFAKLPQPALAPVSIRAIVSDVCALYENAGPVGVTLEPGADATLDADADQLRRAFGNLVKNALEASTAQSGDVRASLTVGPDGVRIDLVDGGSGIARPLSGAELARSIGTTKASGSGFGLPIASKIVHDHGGTLMLEPAPRQGTRAIVRLPSKDRT